MARMNNIYLVFGQRDSGKTTFTKKKIIPLYVAKKRKVLVLHTDEHKGYAHIQPLNIAYLKAWCQNGNKLGPRFCHSKKKERIIEIVNRHFNQKDKVGGLIVFDDFSSWHKKGTSLNEELADLVGQTKQRNIDILFQCHSLAYMPSELIYWADYLVLFKTRDILNKQKDRFPDVSFNAITKAYNDLKKRSKKEYKYHIIELD